MKTKLIRTFIILFLANSYSVMAQKTNMLDSVRIDLGQNRNIEIIAVNFYNLERWGDLDSIYNLFILDLDKMGHNFLNKGGSNSMIYNYLDKYRKIQINSDYSVAGEVSIDAEGNIVHFQTVEFVVGENERMIVKTPTLEGFREINSFNLNALISDSDSTLSPKGRGHKKHISANLNFEDGKYSSEKSVIHSNPGDILELGMVFGLGTVRSVLTPDIEFHLLVGLSQKGQIKHQFGLGYQWLFSFPVNEDGKTTVKNDGFLDAIYSISSKNKETGKTKTAGIKAGVLITSGSPNFQDNTFRAGLFRSLGHGVSLEGGVFMHKNFGEFFPYARLSWSW